MMQAVLAGPIHQLLLQLLTLVVVAVLATVGHRVVLLLDTHLTARQRELLASAAKDAVLWAEEFGGSTGEAKFKSALTVVQKVLSHYGFTLSDIEAAVQAAYAEAVKDGLLTVQPPSPPVKQ
jgi:Tfp pilus assembly protein PilX